VFLVLGVIFIARNRGDALRTTGVSVFVFGVVFLLSMSGVYHLLPHGSNGARHLTPIYIGALAYTVGAILEYANQPVLVPRVVGPHEVFHAMVLIGIGSHWFFIRRIGALGRDPSELRSHAVA